jgi:CheY-like chemotaxis protein
MGVNLRLYWRSAPSVLTHPCRLKATHVSYVASQRSGQPLRRSFFLNVRHASLPATAPRPLARILVSDDDPSIRAIYGALLAEHGFEYLGAPTGDGRATLELARRGRPHLLITDVNKPGLDGFALRAALRAEPATARLPILMISAMDPWGGARPGPLDDYLVKPFLTEALIYRVAALLPLDPGAHDRLAARAQRLPCYEQAHPLTGLPCLHCLADALPAATAEPGWAAIGVRLTPLVALVRAMGRAEAEGLFARLGAIVARTAGRALLLGHTGFDGQIALVGPAERVAAAGEAIAASFEPLLRRARQAAPGPPAPRLVLRRAGDDAGLRLGLAELRAALRA